MVLLRCWYPELTEDVDVLEHSVLLIMLIVSAVLGHTAASAPLQNCKNVSEISAHVLRGARSSLDAPCGGTSAAPKCLADSTILMAARRSCCVVILQLLLDCLRSMKGETQEGLVQAQCIVMQARICNARGSKLQQRHDSLNPHQVTNNTVTAKTPSQPASQLSLCV